VKIFAIAGGAVALLVVIVLHADGGLHHTMLSAGAPGARAVPQGGR